ncbi:hypothetical protein, partial [Barnesiella sp.]|uniref:hypothetical protein n=1 Tax=Barnesiella sp. TaxID=2033407 RepID=UPI00258A8AB5
RCFIVVWRLQRYNFLLRNCYFYPIILGWETLVNHSFAHRRYGDWYFHMQLMCPTRFVVTSELRCKGTT